MTELEKKHDVRAENVELSNREGTANKLYLLRLESDGDAWTVTAQWGRRGKALQCGTKASGVSYEAAQRVYDKLLREKMAKGYVQDDPIENVAGEPTAAGAQA
jgi:predicted DNA-binding WGR domain protein